MDYHEVANALLRLLQSSNCDAIERFTNDLGHHGISVTAERGADGSNLRFILALATGQLRVDSLYSADQFFREVRSMERRPYVGLSFDLQPSHPPCGTVLPLSNNDSVDHHLSQLQPTLNGQLDNSSRTRDATSPTCQNNYRLFTVPNAEGSGVELSAESIIHDTTSSTALNSRELTCSLVRREKGDERGDKAGRSLHIPAATPDTRLQARSPRTIASLVSGRKHARDHADGIAELAQRFIRPDIVQHLKQSLPRWKLQGLWHDSELSQPQDQDTGSASLLSAYSCLCQLDNRVDDNQLRSTIAMVMLQVAFDRACLEWRRFQDQHRRHKGRGDSSVIIDGILQRVHGDWANPEAKQRLRARFHDKKRHGKRWSTLIQSLGPGSIIACSSHIFTAIQDTSFTTAMIKQLVNHVREYNAYALSVIHLLDEPAQRMLREGRCDDRTQPLTILHHLNAIIAKENSSRDQMEDVGQNIVVEREYENAMVRAPP